MAAQRGMPSSAVRVLEEALGMGLTAAGDARDTADAVAAEGAYYLEQVTITEASEDDYEYEEIPDDNFSIPEGEEDLAKAIQMAQEQATDTEILERKTVLPSKHAVPEVIEDFLCNFLIKMGMTRTLDCFQSEWYELIQKGVTELRTVGNVPDVYTQIMLLENENKNLKKDLKHYKQAADKAREDLLKIQKERDFHRMHHKRIVQEKNKLINDLKGLKLHYASYEPTIRVLHEKHHTLLKEKMLTSLERDKVVGQISGLQETLKKLQRGHSYHGPQIKVDHSREKENAPEGPTQKGLREAREQNKCKTKMKGNTKDSEFPIDMQPNPNLNVSKESLSPAKFDYKLKNIFRLHELPVSCVSMQPHKDILVSCGEDRLWKVLGLPKCNVLLTGFGHTDWLSDCCFHPSGDKLATSSGDTTVKLWDLCKGDCILTFEGHSRAVWSCTWHSCGNFVASSSLDKTSKIWDVNSERCRCTLYGHTDSVNSIEFFPFSNTLLTSSADKTLSIWDARTGICEQSLYGHMHSINDAIFDPRGHMIASCDACGVTKLWDFRKLLPIVSIDIGPSPGNEVNFDSSGRVLAQASGNGVIHLLDLKSGEIHKLMGHENEAHTVVFSHDGEILFSGGSDGTVRTWS
ncbi:sperm-associated antigen 16 protein isoform 1 [Homo sapiens]|uniref:Sperm-associated antigen 16 protein n=11 Tax=Homo sapiens TaxID=9606 RepID=SPG16_HUMAN|nr:sperm-associated antigen 16 protein isoform 1 [Homo sapiens]Q8N0X2.2 RecName: Full=Sperm-associated antigen 16 protein; AltName: Full=Pf20 protein homolog [Homo sapiens]|eukprot:NP_078808.3 sperm-associated antigen 16 protein isoform 1 [Homo sapiens]